MTPLHHKHQLQGRTEDELLWYRRRSLLQAASLWVAAGGWGAAMAQQRSNIVELRGDATRNGRPLTAQHTIAVGDRIETGPGSTVVFAVGNSAFQLRQNTQASIEGDTPTAVKILRLVSGAAASVWSKGGDRQVILPTSTAGIRGTGVYAEIFADQGNRGYFCNCYGTVDLATGSDSVVSEASYHQSYWIENAPRNDRLLTPAAAINHTDEELEFLAGLIGQRTAWQISGRKGNRDGSGYMPPATPAGGGTAAPSYSAPYGGQAGPAGAGGATPRPRSAPASPYGSDY